MRFAAKGVMNNYPVPYHYDTAFIPEITRFAQVYGISHGDIRLEEEFTLLMNRIYTHLLGAVSTRVEDYLAQFEPLHVVSNDLGMFRYSEATHSYVGAPQALTALMGYSRDLRNNHNVTYHPRGNPLLQRNNVRYDRVFTDIRDCLLETHYENLEQLVADEMVTSD